MSEQTLNNKLGNCIGEHKKELFDQLKAGVRLEVAIEQFIFSVSYALREIVKNLNPGNVSESE